MSRRFDIVTFDCYGTLVDWETGISSSFATEARKHGLNLEREAILREHARIEPLVQAESFSSYREVLIETTVRIANEVGWNLDRETARFLPDGLEDWLPFPDTNGALERLVEEGYALGILSNVDDDLLAGTLRRLTVEFELIVTAEQVRSYKPAHGHFDEARRKIGDRRWLHAAQSWFHDVEPACELAIPSAWVNRKNEIVHGTARPQHQVGNMAGLADLLCPSPRVS
jgi:2-haloalkanoic acid dehalogenase type II